MTKEQLLKAREAVNQAQGKLYKLRDDLPRKEYRRRAQLLNEKADLLEKTLLAWKRERPEPLDQRVGVETLKELQPLIEESGLLTDEGLAQIAKLAVG